MNYFKIKLNPSWKKGWSKIVSMTKTKMWLHVYECFVPSCLHPLFLGPGHGSSSLSRDNQTFLGGFLGAPQSLLLVEYSWNTSLGRLPWHFQNRPLNHLGWLLFMWMSSGSTLSNFQLTELFRISLSEHQLPCGGNSFRSLVSAFSH